MTVELTLLTVALVLCFAAIAFAVIGCLTLWETCRRDRVYLDKRRAELETANAQRQGGSSRCVL